MLKPLPLPVTAGFGCSRPPWVTLGGHHAEDQVVEAGREEEVGQEVHQDLDLDQDQAGEDDQNLKNR